MYPKTFREACRENTGSHILDSGGAYGRHHERPPIPRDSPIVTWRRGNSPTIHTGAFLDSTMEIDRHYMAAFDRWQRDREGDWFRLGREYMQHRHPEWECLTRENVYNAENDLDQMYVFEVWGPSDNPGWMYLGPDESMVVIYMHTGCDVRGGYGRPLFCHAIGGGEYVLPLNWVAGFYPISAHDPEGNPVEGWNVPGIDRLSVGYSSHPFSELERWASRIFWHTLTPEGTVVILTPGGYVVKIGADAPTC